MLYFMLLCSAAVLFCVAVMFAYEQCLLVLGHHPDVWYEAAQYLEQSSKLLAEKGVNKKTFRLVKLSKNLKNETLAQNTP